jgi:uncharacterized protein (DUF1697 family)
MIQSAAIKKVKALPAWKEQRADKKRAKKAEAEARKKVRKYHPSPINAEIVAEIDDSAPTRDELVMKAEELGIEFRKNISYAKLLGLIEAELASETEV